MSRYDGLIIPRSYSEYINKTDAATLLQALQLSGVMDAAPTENSNKPAKSGGVYEFAVPKTREKNDIATFLNYANWGIKVIEKQYSSTSENTWQPLLNVEYSKDGKKNSLGFFQNNLICNKNREEQNYVVLSQYENETPIIIKHKTLTQTTNNFGTFIFSGRERPLYVRITNIQDAMWLVGNNNDRTWLKICNYDFTPKANTSVTIDMYYI